MRVRKQYSQDGVLYTELPIYGLAQKDMRCTTYSFLKVPDEDVAANFVSDAKASRKFESVSDECQASGLLAFWGRGWGLLASAIDRLALSVKVR